MVEETRLELTVVEQRVCNVASELLGIAREKVLPSSRLIEDLHCDSLEMVELMMELEDEFGVTIPNEPTHPVGKSVFTRHPFRLSDLAEIVYLQQGSGPPIRAESQQAKVLAPNCSELPFSQLSGRWQSGSSENQNALLEPIGTKDGMPQFRRRSDGMRCVLLPAAELKMGSESPNAHPDEQPFHTIALDSFLIDAEPVSTTAYCRFLNSVAATEANFTDWFQLAPSDHRRDQLQIVLTEKGWCPVVGAETFPMVLVSWFGANAYSLWANGSAWQFYKATEGFLPSEAQWEYAAQGAFPESSSNDSEAATHVFGQHQRGAHYHANSMPMAPVHSPNGLSSFGLHHMAGNVWQWCRDWFASDFYQQPESLSANPVNDNETGVRSERGGSWVGPIELCRTTYRRGRNPHARGRCLGFRCISSIEKLP